MLLGLLTCLYFVLQLRHDIYVSFSMKRWSFSNPLHNSTWKALQEEAVRSEEVQPGRMMWHQTWPVPSSFPPDHQSHSEDEMLFSWSFSNILSKQTPPCLPLAFTLLHPGKATHFHLWILHSFIWTLAIFFWLSVEAAVSERTAS